MLIPLLFKRRCFFIIICGMLSAVSITLFLSSSLPVHAVVSGFVTRSGTQLMLNGSPFRYAGSDMYWLGLDENYGGIAYPTQFRVDDALATAQEMGETVVRAHSLGISTGCSLCVEPSLGVFNQTALQHIDYAVKSAGDHGVRLIIPLTDNYHYYNGGKHNFTDWRSISDESEFYTNTTVIGDFEQYVSTLLNHVNTYTGVAYKDDPTIMGWETGNELLPPSSWTQTIADYLKSIDSNHLVIDGYYGVNSGDLSIANVDIISSHFNNSRYAMTAANVNSQASAAQAGGKAFLIGEFDWNNHKGGDPLASFLSNIESNQAVAGDTFWSFFPHADTYGYVQHNDGFTLHYPGDTSDMQTRTQELRGHAYTMRGLATPAASAPTAPLITSVTGDMIAWRGAIGAATYSVERATDSASGPWTVICDRCATDNTAPWEDQGQPAGTLWYRVRGYNLSATAGAYSATYETIGHGTAKTTLVDDLNNWNLSYSHTANLAFDTTNTANFNGDTSRAYRTSATGEAIIWRQPGLASFSATTYFWPSEAVSPFTVSVSYDGTTWYAVAATVTGGSGNWVEYTYSIHVAGTDFVKMTWNNTSGESWSPQIGSVTLMYAATVNDDLFSLNQTTSHSANLTFDTTNTSNFNGDTSRLVRTTATNEAVTWLVAGKTTFTALTYFWPSETVSPFTLLTSTDASTWTTAAPSVTGGSGNWKQYTYTLSVGNASYVQVRWNNTSGKYWSPQIGSVTIQ